MPKIEINPQFEQVLNFVNRTNQLIFLTGKAGTGKTTLLKHLREHTLKQTAVVAPTGVAAVNAGGATIHSFFQFPFGPFVPALKPDGSIDHAQSKLPAFRFNSRRLSVLRNLELLVIDEISMVRADLLDQIDLTLRRIRQRYFTPFGGVQVLFIGDMYQLPPVISTEEQAILRSAYRNPYFFESFVVRENPPVYIELEKIYRQNETVFIDLLNKVRNNMVDEKVLQLLNEHYKSSISTEEYKTNITLTTHNRKADEINTRNLQEIKGAAFVYNAEIEGTFPEKSYPADETLTLKKGARVMFIKNNPEKNFYNGKIGVVTFLEASKIKVRCEEDEHDIEIGPEDWSNVSYELDKSSATIQEKILGTFSQLPVRLAWAITIHKSQGLTFDRVIIDAAEAFSAGQVYVALSRCRSISGLTLSSRINASTLYNDRDILKFASARHSEDQLNDIYQSAQSKYIQDLLSGIFDLTEARHFKNDLSSAFVSNEKRLGAAAREWFRGFSQQFDNLAEVSKKFLAQLGGLFLQSTSSPESDENLQERIRKASVYFGDAVSELLASIRKNSVSTEHKETASEISENMQQVYDKLSVQLEMMKACSAGFAFNSYIKARLSIKLAEYRINVYASSSNSRVMSDANYPELYKLLLRKRDEICSDYQRDVFMVANAKTLVELCNFLPLTHDDLLEISGFGQRKVEEFGDEFLSVIRSYCSEHNLETQMHLKSSDKKKKKEKKGFAAFGGKEKNTNTRAESLRLLNEGMRIEEVARHRGLTFGTIAVHMLPFIKSGEIDLGKLLPKEKQGPIRECIESLGDKATLTEIRAKLGGEYSFHEIRWVLAAFDRAHAG